MGKEAETNKALKIAEIAKDLCSRYPMCTCTERDGHCTIPMRHAEIIYDLGYTKNYTGTWNYYSTTMMECSVCKKHVPKHRYNYCPECGSRMLPNSPKKPVEDDGWKQLTLFDAENFEV